ncbi:MAG: isoprenylcysteine carboxylmethyltransferase family protein [candidate division FCPU426 bacterium]
MAKRKITLFGIGPWLALIGALYFSQAAIITLDHLRFYNMVFVSRKVDENAGLLLFAAGFLVFLAAQAALIIGWFKERLLTTGLFRLCRHPMYAAWILIILPGMGLMLHSWLILANVLVVFIAFKFLIRREDRKLEEAFGPEYLAYRARTSELLPWPRK